MYCTTVINHGNAMIPEIVLKNLRIFSVDSVIIADFSFNSVFSWGLLFKIQNIGKMLQKKEVLSFIVQD